MSKKIAVVTGSRAEFGLFKLLLEMINESQQLELDLIVTGSHLDESYGFTFHEVAAEGFINIKKINLGLEIESEADVGQVLGRTIMKFSKYLSVNKPDLVLLIGDRYEIFGVAVACAIQGIPVGHIHGGEVTQGSRDEVYRHLLTRISSIHFVANEEFKQNVINLGEKKETVHIVGGLGVDVISKTELIAKSEIERKLGYFLSENLGIVTFHPDTTNPSHTLAQVNALLNAIINLPDFQFIITGSNADFQGATINSIWKAATEKNKNLFFIESLGQQMYFSLLALAKIVVGNSSSGLLEAPEFNIATINIGSRQNGRPTAKSVINVECSTESITLGILESLTPEFQINLLESINPYGPPGASEKIIKILEKLDYDALVPKKFL